MSVEKISATTPIVNQLPTKTEEKTVTTSFEPDKKLSDSAKLMIGATLLAGTIAIGIIGHKNNWWRQAGKSVTSEPPKPSSDTLKPPKKPVIDADAHTEEFLFPTEEVSGANVEKFLAELKKSNYVKPIEIPSDIPEKIDFSSAVKNEAGLFVLPIKDDGGKLLREYCSKNGKDLSVVKIYDNTIDKPQIIIKYATEYGKTFITEVNELFSKNPDKIKTLKSLKKCIYRRGTNKIKSISSRDSLERLCTVNYGENGEDIINATLTLPSHGTHYGKLITVYHL